jgi:hypothetical protein
MRVDAAEGMAKSSRRPAAAISLDSSSSSAVGAYDRDRVAVRAYELYMARGGSDGRDMEDWLTAEREFRSNGGSERHDD